MSTVVETQRRRRGHQFFPPKAAKLPALYATESVSTADKVVRAHYFVAGFDWWIVEYDPEECLAFGYACLNDPANAEWGYVSLVELERLVVGGFLVIERDVYWEPRTVRELDLPGRPF